MSLKKLEEFVKAEYGESTKVKVQYVVSVDTSQKHPRFYSNEIGFESDETFDDAAAATLKLMQYELPFHKLFPNSEMDLKLSIDNDGIQTANIAVDGNHACFMRVERKAEDPNNFDAIASECVQKAIEEYKIMHERLAEFEARFF
jgi:hypothetical protein